MRFLWRRFGGVALVVAVLLSNAFFATRFSGLSYSYYNWEAWAQAYGATATPTPTVTPTVTPTPTVTATPTITPTPLALGEACISGTQCASTFCATGVCCNAPCTEPNQSCDLPGSSGRCRPLGGEVPAASQTGIVALCALLAAVGVGSLISVRYRRRS